MRLISLPLLAVLCAGCGTGTNVASQPAPAAVVAEITAAEDAWARAIIETDTVVLGRLLAPEFVLVGVDPADPPFPRAAWMTNVATKRVYTDSVVIDSLAVSGGADSAVATMRYFWRPLVEGRRMPDDLTRLRDTWVRRDGRWQVVMRQRLDPPPERGERPR